MESAGMEVGEIPNAGIFDAMAGTDDGGRNEGLLPSTVDCSLFTDPQDADLDERLRESDRNIEEAWIGLAKRSMLIGWEGYFIKRHNGWQRLGYEDEKHYRATKRIARSTWYKMVGLAERFPYLNREEFIAMSIDNAEQLAATPLTTRHIPELVRAAATKSVKDFESDLVLEQAEREEKPVGEIYVTMKWRIKQAQREVIERGLEDWQHDHGIDDPGYALELAFAELHDRPTLVGFINESIPRLSREVLSVHTGETGELAELRQLRETFAHHLREMGEILKLVCGEGGAAAQ